MQIFSLKINLKKINELARTIDQKYHFELGQSLREIRDLLAQRYFIFDLNISFKDLNTDHIQLGELNIWNEVFMLKINEVLSFESSLFRILTILPDSVIWISLDLENAFPIEVSRTEILKRLGGWQY